MENINVSCSVYGTIVSAEFPKESNVCVRVQTVAAETWELLNPDKLLMSSFTYRGLDNKISIDLPFSFTLKGSSSFMWPRLVLNCFSKTSLNQNCLIGYGVLPFPTEPGKHQCRIYCFSPESSSFVQKVLTTLRGLSAEFADPLLPATSEGRHHCRTSTRGYVDIELYVNIKTAGGLLFSVQNMEKRIGESNISYSNGDSGFVAADDVKTD